MAPNLLPRYVLDKILLKEFAFKLFEIGQTIALIKRKVKAWPEIPVSIGPFKFINHGHARKELEDYLEYRWIPTPIQRHDLKGLILSHFQKLGLMMLYRHEVHPDDSFFEDTRVFEDAITRMRLRHILEERIDVLKKDPDLDKMEWRRQCFEAGSNEEKNDESDKGKEKENPTTLPKKRSYLQRK